MVGMKMGDAGNVLDDSLSPQTQRMDLGNSTTTPAMATRTGPAEGSTEAQDAMNSTATKNPGDVFQGGNQNEYGNSGNGNRYLATMQPTADTLFSDLSMNTVNASDGNTNGRVPSQQPLPSSPAAPSQSSNNPSQPRSKWQHSIVWKVWSQGKGMLMVILSQFFGASMNVMTQVLERDGAHGKAMHPFQILFTRMIITVMVSYLYMWYVQVPNPFGTREVRGLLILRAAGGFFGVFGMYFSLLYMPLSEATVLTFLAPIVACYACSFLMPNEPFTRKQQIAGLVSLLGVVLIARPFSGGKVDEEPSVAEIASLIDGSTNTSTIFSDNEAANSMASGVSASQHLMAIGFALLGVLGAACAYVTIRLIGSKTHPLVSVTYFSAYTTTVSLVTMIAIPSVSFRLPGNLIEWGLLFGLGTTGFTMQYLLTAGLSYQPPAIGGKSAQKGNGTRATSMLYTQMLFALFYDKVVMDSSPSFISWIGSGLILGSALHIGIVQGNNKASSGSITRNTTQDNSHAHEENVPIEEGLQTERRKDITSVDIRYIEEGRGLLTDSDEIDAEPSCSSSR